MLRGWGNYFRTGNAAKRFNQLDTYVWRRLAVLRIKRKGRHLRSGEAARWLPGDRVMPRPERPPGSRVREIRTHGLKGGLDFDCRGDAVKE